MAGGFRRAGRCREAAREGALSAPGLPRSGPRYYYFLLFLQGLGLACLHSFQLLMSWK